MTEWEVIWLSQAEHRRLRKENGAVGILIQSRRGGYPVIAWKRTMTRAI